MGEEGRSEGSYRDQAFEVNRTAHIGEALGIRSEGSYRDQAFEASMLIRKAIAKSVSRDVIAVRRLKHPEAPYHKKASLWIFEDPERGFLVIGGTAIGHGG